MKLITKAIFLFATLALLVNAQPLGQAPILQTQSGGSAALPPYVVYRHFLAWANQLDKAASASGSSDPYQFAQPFSRADLEHQHLDIIRDAAHRLDADLQAHQARAQQIITRYRQQAKQALAQGKPLPPAPPEVHDLELQRTALLVHHYVMLRTSLGPEVSAKLDKYLSYEFAPHIKMRRMASPAAPAQASH